MEKQFQIQNYIFSENLYIYQAAMFTGWEQNRQ